MTVPRPSPRVEERIGALEEAIRDLQGTIGELREQSREEAHSVDELAKEVAASAASLGQLQEAVGESERVARKAGRLVHGWERGEGKTAKATEALREDFSWIKELLRQVDVSLQGVVRLLTIDPEELPYPQRLTVQRFRVLSQQQEDGLIWAILKAARPKSRSFVELGCGDNGGNSGFLATELGWTGLMVDGSADNAHLARRRFGPTGVTVAQRWLTREDVDEFLIEHGMEGEVDLLSIDIDGNDYWVWEAIEACSPRLVVIEYNSALGATRSVTVPYDPEFALDKGVLTGIYFGASLKALTRLGERKGYRLVATENVNAFLLREDVAPDIPDVEPERAFHMYPKLGLRLDALGKDLFEALDEEGLELVEIE